MSISWVRLPLLSAITLIPLLIILTATRPLPAADTAAPAAIYDKIIADYMNGKWADVENNLKPNIRRLSTLSVLQKANLEYINQAISDGRPAWWDDCKSGKQALVKATIFGSPVEGVYDPEQKPSMNISSTNGLKSVTLGWPAADMDSTSIAEHGFTKGDLAACGIWSTLGSTSVYLDLPIKSLVNSSDADKLQLSRVVDFRGNLTAAYYGSPRTRQWAMFLSMHYYQLKYYKSPIVMSRKALGAMLTAEIVSHRPQYPSIELPGTLGVDNAEENLVKIIHDWVEKNRWTFAEDRLLRESIKAFAVANAAVSQTGGPVKLPNGLEVSLDPDTDATLRTERDHWLVQKLQKQLKK